MKLKLAIVRQRYNAFGGAERFIARALPALERAGAEVTLIARQAEGWGARRVLRVDPFHIGKVWRDWSFARAARSAWRREGFDVVQSHERIPGCDVYRAGDGVHRRWLELRARVAGMIERLGMAISPYHRYVCAAERRLFEHPRLRAVICNSQMVANEIRRAFRIDAGKRAVTIDRKNSGQCDARNTAIESNEFTGILNSQFETVLFCKCSNNDSKSAACGIAAPGACRTCGCTRQRCQLHLHDAAERRHSSDGCARSRCTSCR